MGDVDTTYRVVAASTSKRGDLVVEDSAGRPWLFVGSTGCLSRAPLVPEFVDNLVQHEHWQVVADERRFALEDLRHWHAKPRHPWASRLTRVRD